MKARWHMFWVDQREDSCTRRISDDPTQSRFVRCFQLLTKIVKRDPCRIESCSRCQGLAPKYLAQVLNTNGLLSASASTNRSCEVGASPNTRSISLFFVVGFLEWQVCIRGEQHRRELSHRAHPLRRELGHPSVPRRFPSVDDGINGFLQLGRQRFPSGGDQG